MSAETPKYGSHSADVRMELCIDGQVLSIAQLGPDFLLLDYPFDHSPVEAQITVTVDGRRHGRLVYLPEGIKAGVRRVKLAGWLQVNGSTVG